MKEPYNQFATMYMDSWSFLGLKTRQVCSISCTQYEFAMNTNQNMHKVKVWCPSSLRSLYTMEVANCPVSVCAHPCEPHILSYTTSSMYNAVLFAVCTILCAGSITGVDLRSPKVKLFEISGCDKPFTYVEFISSKEVITR